ncbi:MAG: Gfo/Idh/MocA family oxidoreductase [Promethearchaeota archaeon]|nr:MAG: Gfo/Idh/MocA family oxidoreductase [Candidatus Lokiarchaeota archaeon]
MNVGFIGTGKIFDLHILGYLENNEVEIAALCDIDQNKAEMKAKKFKLRNSVNIYSDFKEMMKQENLDLIEILLPPTLNAEVTHHIARMGIKAISINPPIAPSLDKTDQIIQRCKENNIILSVYESYYFAPHIQKAKKLIETDYIGDPTSIRIKTAIGSNNGWNIQDEEKEKGFLNLLDIGWHSFALPRLFFKEKIKKVFGWSSEYKGLKVPAYVMFEFEQTEKHPVPQYGNLEFSLLPEMKLPSNYYPVDEFIEIIGTQGLMKINQGISIGNAMTDSDVFAPLIIVRDGKVESYNEFPKDLKYSFIKATEHFINTAKGKKRPLLDGETAKSILKFNLAAIQSSQKEKEIYL